MGRSAPCTLCRISCAAESSLDDHVVKYVQVSLRTLNQAQSAFVVFTLRESFFSDFIMPPGGTASVKLHLKNVVSIFKATNNVQKLWIQVACSGEESYMRVQQECTNGLRKKFDLAFEEVALQR